jgi:hypothetical protein
MHELRFVYLEDLRKQFSWIDKAWLMGFAYWLPLPPPRSRIRKRRRW